MTDKEKIKVIFKKESDGSGDVVAIFPDVEWAGGDCTCYAHIGQHSACALDYADDCEDATPDEYADLKRELEDIGYVLEIGG